MSPDNRYSNPFWHYLWWNRRKWRCESRAEACGYGAGAAASQVMFPTTILTCLFLTVSINIMFCFLAHALRAFPATIENITWINHTALQNIICLLQIMYCLGNDAECRVTVYSRLSKTILAWKFYGLVLQCIICYIWRSKERGFQKTCGSLILRLKK